MKYLYPILIICVCACTPKKNEIFTNESFVNREDYLTLHIPEYFENTLQIDSIFENIEVIPLETNKRCLISLVSKAHIKDSLIYIQNRSDNLFVFSKSGNFIKEISRKGKGPGEFFSLRDFDIDQDGKVYILDFLKILEFSREGKFLTKYKYSFSPKDPILCNPLQFALCGLNDFYIWGGSFSINNNKNKNLFSLYKIDKKGEIKERYFPLTHKESFNPKQFSKYSDHYNLIPLYGSNMIFKVSNNGVFAKYYVDFGKFTMNEIVPEEYNNLSDFKSEIDQKYANSIRDIIEIDDWLYFAFSYKGFMKNIYYSKIINKAFVSKPFPRAKNKIMPWKIDTSDGVNFIALIEPDVLLEDLERIDHTKDEYRKWKEKFKNISVNDNPIILKCKMRKYYTKNEAQ